MRLRCRRTPLSKQEQNTESAEPVETGTTVTAMQAEISRLRAALRNAHTELAPCNSLMSVGALIPRIQNAIDIIREALRGGVETAACQHEWEPVTHYGKPGTGFEMCHKCGADREVVNG